MARVELLLIFENNNLHDSRSAWLVSHGANIAIWVAQSIVRG